jgi:hypothetical protein
MRHHRGIFMFVRSALRTLLKISASFRLARRHESLMPQLKKADNSADWKRQAK